MSQKRIRSINWDEEEKQLFRSVLKEYAAIIENKSLDYNTNKKKCKAWEEIHKKFNELSGRPRQLEQLKIQWKSMKINARKTFNTFKKEVNKTGGGARPTTPNDVVIEIKDLMNPAELLRDHNIYDSDGIETLLTDDVAMSSEKKPNDVVQENLNLAEDIGTIEDKNEQADVEIFLAESVIAQDNNIIVTPVRKLMSAKNQHRQKNISGSQEPGLKSRKENDYINSMLSHSKSLKNDEHMRRMEMAEEEHAIKMAIHQEKLKSAILEREILELKKQREEKN